MQRLDDFYEGLVYDDSDSDDQGGLMVSSDEDDFEDEDGLMALLKSSLTLQEKQQVEREKEARDGGVQKSDRVKGRTPKKKEPTSNKEATSNNPNQEEDDDFIKDFDSDGEEIEFYDSKLDDKDARWMSHTFHSMGLEDDAEAVALMEQSDAVLACPACFTDVSYICQRHERVEKQYRAVFTVNCVVNEQEQVVSKDDRERYFPVSCATCGTDVGVLDEDEVYHFYDVLPSPPHKMTKD